MMAEIICADGFGDLLIDTEALLDSVKIVVGSSTGFTTFKKAFDNLVLVHHEFDHNGIHSASFEQQSKCVRLLYGTRITIENDSFAVLREGVHIVGNKVHHLMVGHKVALGNKFVNLFPQFAAGQNLGTEHITCREVLKSIVFYQEFGLSALTASRGTK
jgi:hypothetical protein